MSREFESVSICSPAQIDVQENAAFDDDDDLVCSAVNPEYATLRFWEPIVDYAAIEFDVISIDDTTQTLNALALTNNIQLPLDTTPTEVTNAALHPSMLTTFRFPYCGEIEGFFVDASGSVRIKDIRVIKNPENFVEVADLTRITPTWTPEASSAATDNGDGTFDVTINPDGVAQVGVAVDFSDLSDAEDCYLVVEISTSVNFGSTQTFFSGQTLYNSQKTQKYYFDANESFPVSFLFHPGTGLGCQFTVGFKIGRFQPAISAFGVATPITVTQSVVSAASDL